MNNEILKELTTDWRSTARKIIENKIHPELSNSEAWLISNTIEEYAGKLEALIFIDETFNKKDKK